jgi:hypothetical protein
MLSAVVLLAGCRFGVTGLPAGGPSGDFAMRDAGGAGDLAVHRDLAMVPAGPPYLRGSKAPLTGTIDLSAVGTLDWAHWGLDKASDFNHRAQGGSLIPNYTALGNATPVQTDKFQNGFTWSDGTPTAAATDSPTGIYFMGSGNGYGWSFPADTAPRALNLYVDSYLATGHLSAHLDDGSAPDYSDDLSSGGGATYSTYTLRYRAGRATTLHVTWEETSGVGNVGLQAVTLAADSMP